MKYQETRVETILDPHIISDVSDQLLKHADPLLLLEVEAGHWTLLYLSPRTPHVGEDRPAVPLPLVPSPDALEAKPDHVVEPVVSVEGVDLQIDLVDLGKVVGVVRGRYRSVALQPTELRGTH